MLTLSFFYLKNSLFRSGLHAWHVIEPASFETITEEDIFLLFKFSSLIF